MCINLWKVHGAVFRPKGIRQKRYVSPKQENAVLSRYLFAIGTCQYPDRKSRVENTSAPLRDCSTSSILGIGYFTFSVTALIFLKSIQKRWAPDFFFTSSVGLCHGLVHLSMIPIFSIIIHCFFISMRVACGSGHCLVAIGAASFVSMWCSNRVVWPMSSSLWETKSRNCSSIPLIHVCWVFPR